MVTCELLDHSTLTDREIANLIRFAGIQNSALFRVKAKYFVWRENKLIIALAILDQPPLLGIVSFPFFAVQEDVATPATLSAILDNLEKYVRAEKQRGIILIHLENDATDEVLSSLGWEEATVFKKRALFDSETFNPPWLNHPYLPAAKDKIVLFSSLSQEQRDQIHRLHFPDYVSPFATPYEPLNSLALLTNGQVSGWLMTERLLPDIIRFSAFFIVPEQRFSTIAPALLAKSIRILIDNHVLYGEAEVNYGQVDHRWISFFEKRLIPYATTTTTLYKAFKKI